MTRCLYAVAQYPVSPNFSGGGSTIFYDQLMALASLGHEIHLWHQADPESRAKFDAFVAGDGDCYERVVRACRSIERTEIPPRLDLLDRAYARTVDLTTRRRIDNPYYRTVGVRTLRRLINRLRPDVIWAQHFGPAQCAVLQTDVPVVYMHHDWTYKVKALALGQAPSQQRRRMEEDVARGARVVVSGSFSESAQLRDIGCTDVEYIPVAYDSVPAPPAGMPPSPRVVHVGGLGTTANRIGLERFFEVVWPRLSPSSRHMWIIGDMTRAGPNLRTCLAHVECTGFVPDLSSVLRPFDLHVIAWEHDTGTRTRVPLAFNYGQVLVGTYAACAGIPEAQSGENCILVEHLHEMPGVIDHLLTNESERRRLGTAARSTFERRFTRSSLAARYQNVMQRAVRQPVTPCPGW